MLGWADSKSWMCVWVVAEARSVGPLGPPPQVMGRASSSMPTVSSGASFPKCGGQLSCEGQDQLSCVRVMDISTDPGCGRATDPDMAPQLQLRPGCHHGFRWQHRPLRSVWPQWQYDPQMPTWCQVSTQTPGICMAFGGNRSHGHQHRPHLQ